LLLGESLHQHLATVENLDACILQRAFSSVAILEEEVSHTLTVDDERTSPFDADLCLT